MIAILRFAVQEGGKHAEPLAVGGGELSGERPVRRRELWDGVRDGGADGRAGDGELNRLRFVRCVAQGSETAAAISSVRRTSRMRTS